MKNNNLMSSSFIVGNIGGSEGANALSRAAKSLPGVTNVSINPAYTRLTVEHNTAALDYNRIVEALDGIGFELTHDSQDNRIV